MRSTAKIAAISAAVAPLLVTFGSGTASAHGYVSDPPSRQAQCAAGAVDCGSIQWEPQSVEGPKGLRSCSGGNERFAELDDDSKDWQSTPVGETAEFNWSITAAHATSTWEYYVDGTKVAEFDDGGAKPGDHVSHTVDLSDHRGERTVLAVWNIADTSNAFYACTDVVVGAA
ncbi:lytic polysaccharide monooxygenase auxiliary activity family 9 protein [Salinifilum ghardaiensis]